MKILITGSSGMLGQALCNRLGSRHEIIGIDIKRSQSFAEGGPAYGGHQVSAKQSEASPNGTRSQDFYELDITNRDLTIKKIKEIKPDIIIHCAAYTDVDGAEKYKDMAYKLNVQGTENIAQVAKQRDAFLIYMSTDFVFDGKNNSPYTEDDKPNPISVYGETKFEGENAIKKTSDKYLIIRTSWLFGNGGENFVDTVIEKARCKKNVVARFIGQKKELKVVNDQVGSPTYTVDLAKAIEGIIEGRGTRDEGREILHITNLGSCSWYDFAKEIINLAGIKGVNIVPISSQESNRPAKRPKMSILDNSQFCKIYGNTLPSWQDALKRYLKDSYENNLNADFRKSNADSRI